MWPEKNILRLIVTSAAVCTKAVVLLMFTHCCSNFLLEFFGVLDLDLSIKNGIILSKIYDKRDYVNFEIVKIPFLD